MSRLSPFFLFLFCEPALAGCLSLLDPGEGSACRTSAPEILWLKLPRSAESVEDPRPHYEELIADPALRKGVYLEGEASFRFQARGKYLIEVFLMVLDEDKDSLVLEADGVAVDTRYSLPPGPRRLRPRRGVQHLSLLAIVAGGQTLTIRTASGRYLLSSLRWTPQKEFEAKLVPIYLKRVRQLFAGPLFGPGAGGASRRRNYLEQLCSRLALSQDETASVEGAVGVARVLYWLAAENHEPHDLQRAARAFSEALEVAPGHPALRQTISASCMGLNVAGRSMPVGDFCEKVSPIPWDPSLPPAPSGAPEWAVSQRRLARRMEAITRWWVEERQQPNGELGGGWGDDVEIIRSWAPSALGLGSAVAARGIRKLADGVWGSGTLLGGYDRQISDVEHASEPTTDTQPILAALFPHDPEVRNRLFQTSSCARNWIERQPDGQWRFRGSWFNCFEFDSEPQRAVDVHMNTRALGPALWFAYLTREAWIIELLEKWADSWVAAMRSTQHGKPAGIFPPVLRSVDGTYLIRSQRWDRPDVEWDYYQWSGSAQEALTSLLLALYDLTGSRRWLELAGQTFQILDQSESYPQLCEEIVRFPQAFYEWRRRTGNPRYDGKFGYVEEDAESIFTLLSREAREIEKGLSVNFDMFTSEVIYTDRVYYKVTPLYHLYLFGGEAPRGDRYPAFAVTWPAASGEFARAVLASGPDRLELAAYNFETEPLTVPLRVWKLEPGGYRWQVADSKGNSVADGEILVRTLPLLLELPLPPQREVRITIRKIGN